MTHDFITKFLFEYLGKFSLSNWYIIYYQSTLINLSFYFFFLDNFVPRTRDNRIAEFPTNERPGSRMALASGGMISLIELTKSSGSGTRTCLKDCKIFINFDTYPILNEYNFIISHLRLKNVKLRNRFHIKHVRLKSYTKICSIF